MMADRTKVERLFTLPYFQETFNQILKPMVEYFAEQRGSKHVANSKSREKAVEETYRYMYLEMMGIIMDEFVEVFTDEEVDLMYESYQHPVFLKLLTEMKGVIPKMMGWYDKNEDLINRSIRNANHAEDEDIG